MNDAEIALTFIATVLIICIGFGLFTTYNINKKNKANKKLSKKQKRELEK